MSRGATWDRLPLLVGEIERSVHRAIAAKCAELGAEIVYGAVSVSPRALNDVCAYIANQKAHHAAQSLIPEWEPARP